MWPLRLTFFLILAIAFIALSFLSFTTTTQQNLFSGPGVNVEEGEQDAGNNSGKLPATTTTTKEDQLGRLPLIHIDNNNLAGTGKGQITADLIHQLVTSAVEQFDQFDDDLNSPSTNASTDYWAGFNDTTDSRVRRAAGDMIRHVDIQHDHLATGAVPSTAPVVETSGSGSRFEFGRSLQGFEDAGTKVMVVPQEILQQSFENAHADWLSRQRSLEGVRPADPRSPIGTAFGFSAPNEHSLALSNMSSLLEMASREFMKNLKPEYMAGRSKRETDPMEDMNVMSESMMHVNVQPFVQQRPPPDSSPCGKDEQQQCDRNIQIRSFSGVCNNLANPDWGRAVVTLDRMLPPVYNDGISAPRMNSVTGQALPSPRYVSSTIHIDSSHLSQRHTMLLMQYGQFLDHDITLTPVHKAPNGILNCRDCQSPRMVHPECWPIQVPFGDTYYPAKTIDTGNNYCIPFTRSLPGQQRLGPREQINQNSAYLDSSHIYGENICKSMGLRSGGGYLNATILPGAKIMMPQTKSLDMCKSDSGFCFNAGDSRASEQPGLAAVHTAFLREHNRLVDGLHQINPHWSEDRLYQQARRIVIATNQHIAYNEFLPRVLGPTVVNAYELIVEPTFYYSGYDPTCRGEIYNEFSTAAFRFGHSLVRPQVPRMNDNYHGMNPAIQLRDGFFNSDMLMKPLMVDEVLRGLLAEPMEQLDPFITNEVTNHLFEDKTRAFSGMDLISINIQRGRDHGLQGYNAYRAACNLNKAQTFGDFASEIPSDVIERLQVVYAHVDDVDLFTGSLVERPVTGGLIGPTMACIIGSQFRRLRKCDRFWYETNDPVIKFTPQQLAEIRKTTLSKVICDNLDLPSDIQKAAFDAPHNVLNPRLPCERLPTLNLDAWRDNVGPPPPPQALYVQPAPPAVPANPAQSSFCSIGGSSIQVGGSGMSSPCVSCICTPQGTKCASLRITNCAQLLFQNRQEEVLADSICTSQCGHFLPSKGTLSSVGTGNNLLKSPSRFHNFFKKSFGKGFNIFNFI